MVTPGPADGTRGPAGVREPGPHPPRPGQSWAAGPSVSAGGDGEVSSFNAGVDPSSSLPPRQTSQLEVKRNSEGDHNPDLFHFVSNSSIQSQYSLKEGSGECNLHRKELGRAQGSKQQPFNGRKAFCKGKKTEGRTGLKRLAQTIVVQ